MASSKGSPGIHDRRDYGSPRPKCIHLTQGGKGPRCKRDAIGRSKLCKSHKAQAEAQAALAEIGKAPKPRTTTDESRAAHLEKLGPNAAPAQPTPSGIVRGGVSTRVQKEHRQGLGKFVINEQARAALAKLGRADAKTATDPRQTLLDTVASAWRQQQVWEQMLTAVPVEDWQYLGMTPVPGSEKSAKGARIEAIQKFLGEATKSAARISKLAIDAGIEERLVRLAEEQAAMIADTVRAGIVAAMASLVRELRLSKANEANALDVALQSAASHLRLLEAGITEDLPSTSDQLPTTTIEGHARKVG